MPKEPAGKKSKEVTTPESGSFARGFGQALNDDSDSSAESFTWTASEYIAHEKSGAWYAVLLLVAIVLTAAIYFITRDILSSLVVIVGMSLLAVYAGREPRELQYSLRPGALWIGDKEYPYGSFRYYSTFVDGSFRGIDFLPLKRLSTMITIYYHPDDEDKILSILGGRLPQQDHKQDAIERLLRKIRF